MNVDEKAARERWCRDVCAETMGVYELEGSMLGAWLWKMSATSAFQLAPQQMIPFVRDLAMTDDMWIRWLRIRGRQIDRLERENEKLRENLQDAAEPG